MHVLHVSQYCHLVSSFGTERYQYDLMQESARHGVRGTFLWLSPKQGTAGADDGPRVIEAPRERLLVELDRILVADPPALIHFHTIGRDEIEVASFARARGIPYAYTYHVPASLCANGSLLRWGSTPCDGKVLPWRCGACKLVSVAREPHRGQRAAHLLAWSARRASQTAAGPGMGWWARALREFLVHCGAAFVHADSQRDVLLTNGARPDRLIVCALGVSADFAAPARQHTSDDSTFVVGYVGRLEHLKGFDILVEAFRRTTWDRARLRVIGRACFDERSVDHARWVMAQAQLDSRVEFREMQPFAAGTSLYEGISLVAIPSVGAETGPLVLREALQLGLPVLASTRMGEPEMARLARIVEPNTVEAWTQTLESVFDEVRRGDPQARVERLRSPLLRRTMRDVAGDVIEGYEALLAQEWTKQGRRSASPCRTDATLGREVGDSGWNGEL